jgi:hypothetical protein
MGQIISSILPTIGSALQTIVSQLSDPASTTSQLVSIASQLAPVAVPAGMMDDAEDDAVPNTLTSFTNAMAAAVTAVQTSFPKYFPSCTVGNNVDSGVVQNYCGGSNADLTQLESQIKTDFTNWQIVVSDAQISAMASTINVEVAAQSGKTGTSYGVYNIDANEGINWVVAYGSFASGTNAIGLVYGFGVVFNSGWGKKK